MALVALALPAQVMAAEWTLLKSVAGVQYVVVPAMQERNRVVYQDAIAALCKSDTLCVIQFFNDPGLVPTDPAARPTPAQSDARLGSYVFNPASGFKSMYLACRVENPPERCQQPPIPSDKKEHKP